MKSALVAVRCLLLISMLLVIGCASGEQKSDVPVEPHQIKNDVFVTALPPEQWISDVDPNKVPIQKVSKSESRILLPAPLLGDIEDVAVRIKDIIYNLNSRASVEIKDNIIIIRNMYEGNPDHKIFANNLFMPDEKKSVRGVGLLLTETTWATMNVYPEALPDSNAAKSGADYQVCTIAIKGFSINIIHGKVGAVFVSDGKTIGQDIVSVNKPGVAVWKRCLDM